MVQGPFDLATRPGYECSPAGMWQFCFRGQAGAWSNSAAFVGCRAEAGCLVTTGCIPEAAGEQCAGMLWHYVHAQESAQSLPSSQAGAQLHPSQVQAAFSRRNGTAALAALLLLSQGFSPFLTAGGFAVIVV